MMGRPLKLTAEQIEELMSLKGKINSVEAGKKFGIDHSTALFYWKRTGEIIKLPKPKMDKSNRIPTVKLPLGKSYAQHLAEFQKKTFVRDEKGNLIKVTGDRVLADGRYN